MGFTLKALIPPLLLIFISGLMHMQYPEGHTGELGARIGVYWTFVAVPIVFVYWAVRLVKRATRDASDPYQPR